MDIGSRLRSARKAKSLSQERLARQADVSLNMVSRLERGEIADPHISGLRKIADALDMSIGELLGEPVPLAEASPSGPLSRAEEEAADEEMHDPEVVERVDREVRVFRRALQIIEAQNKGLSRAEVLKRVKNMIADEEARLQGRGIA